MWYAAASVAGTSSARFTRNECLVIGIVMPTMSTSWNASVPIEVENTWPVMRMIGTESMCASAIAVTRLVAPGPEVAMATPTLPTRRGVALGRVACALLVAHQDVADARRGHELVVERHDRTAREAEDVGDAERFEGLEDRARSR